MVQGEQKLLAKKSNSLLGWKCIHINNQYNPVTYKNAKYSHHDIT